jgi:5-methylcytosine-specific restriction endonuclease McrA
MEISVPIKRKGTPAEQAQRDRFTKLRSMFRRAWMLDPERIAALYAARRLYHGENKRQKWEYKCVECFKNNPERGYYMLKEVVVDHILPSGTFLGPEHFATFVPNLFCSRDNLQILCKPCHKIKTKEERGIK